MSKNKSDNKDIKISKRFKDILQKHASKISTDNALEFYGIKTAKT